MRASARRWASCSPVGYSAAPASAARTGCRVARPTMPLRLLLVDDDARLAELLRDYFAPQGISLVHAAGGQAGLAALAGDAFDAVLLDVMMPGMDGLEVLRRLRVSYRMPVIML